MPSHPLKKNIKIIFDFDYTLSREFMENPILRMRGIDPQSFWDKVVALEEENKGDETTFLSYFLHLMHTDRLKGLTKEELRKSGKKVLLSPGVSDFFDNIRDKFMLYPVELEFHVVSSGFKEVIEGTKVSPYLSSVYATRFCDTLTKGDKIDSFIEIVLSAKKVDRIRELCGSGDFSNIIYVGDGQSDIPAFRFVKKRRGLAVKVFAPKQADSVGFTQLLKDGIIDHAVPADFREGSALFSVIEDFVMRKVA